MSARKEKTYISFDPSTGYPAGSNLYYECLRCGESIPSLPDDSVVCRCRNISIDIDYGRVSVEDHNLMRVFLLGTVRS